MDVFVFAHLLLQRIQRERAELLQSKDGEITLLSPQRLPLLQQGIKMFAGTEDEGLNTVGDKAGNDVERSSRKNCVRRKRRLDFRALQKKLLGVVLGSSVIC